MTWLIAVRIVGSLSDNVPALDLQAATGLLAVIVLLAIGVVVAAIFVVTRRGPSTEPNVVYVNPSFSTAAPAPPAP